MKSHYPGCMSDEECKCQDYDNERYEEEVCPKCKGFGGYPRCPECLNKPPCANRSESLEIMYQKVASACLRCDPVPACKRLDDQLEPPWEVIDRMLDERNTARVVAADAIRELERILETGDTYATREIVDNLKEFLVGHSLHNTYAHR